MKQLDILVEELSMTYVLRAVLPQVLPVGWELNQNVFIRTHDGKQDLRNSIPLKLRAARKSGIKRGFIILQDQDSNNCVALKNDIDAICRKSLGMAPVPYLVRIVCHELEAWYLGDMEAIEHVSAKFKKGQYENRALFRNPDSCVNPKSELKKMIGDYQQIEMAKNIGPEMNIANNKSNSFNCFISGIQRLIAQM